MPNKHEHAELTEFQKQVCVGSLLGDMSASRPSNGKNFHLSCYHSEKQIEWLKQKWSWLLPHARPIQYCSYIDRRDGNSRSGARFHTISAPCFTEIAQLFYKGGKKIIQPEMKTMLTAPVALACLICDDGSWDGAGISIATNQFTLRENQSLSRVIGNNYGLQVSVMNHGRYPYLRITAESVHKAFDLCKPYTPEFLWYKFGGEHYQTSLVGKLIQQCPVCRETFSAYASANQEYCSRKCAAIGRPGGYRTRHAQKECPLCHKDFTPYMNTQQTCLNCRDKPFPNERCRICDSPVKKHGNVYCSHRCSVIGCHRSQGHRTMPP